MFMNCSVFCDVWHVRSSVLGQNVMFKCLKFGPAVIWRDNLVLELTVWCSWTVQFFVMFDMFKVRFWAKMWCSESSMFRHSMFGVFKFQYFGVCSKTSTHYTPYIHNDILMFSQMGNGNICALNHKDIKLQCCCKCYLPTYSTTTNKHSVNLPFKCLMEKRTNCVFKVTH